MSPTVGWCQVTGFFVAHDSCLPFAQQKAEVTKDTTPNLKRQSNSRRSSYAFSHLEGYASLITQGMIMRRSTDIHPNLLSDLNFKEQETSKPQSWDSRKMSWPARKRRLLHQGIMSSLDSQPASPLGFCLEERSSEDLEKSSSFPKH